VSATTRQRWHDLQDQKRCIGCGYCIQACPYGARYLIPHDADRSPTGNVGVADKCTWCYHRITKGQLPACVEACPVGARVFGDLNDPESPVRKIMRDTRVTVLKPDLDARAITWAWRGVLTVDGFAYPNEAPSAGPHRCLPLHPASSPARSSSRRSTIVSTSEPRPLARFSGDQRSRCHSGSIATLVQGTSRPLRSS
jgi:ferredoxin